MGRSRATGSGFAHRPPGSSRARARPGGHRRLSAPASLCLSPSNPLLVARPVRVRGPKCSPAKLRTRSLPVNSPAAVELRGSVTCRAVVHHDRGSTGRGHATTPAKLAAPTSSASPACSPGPVSPDASSPGGACARAERALGRRRPPLQLRLTNWRGSMTTGAGRRLLKTWRWILGNAGWSGHTSCGATPAARA